ncbi:MAG TPA: hypothetical protein VGT44_18250 [Ktedonobacteraceae bacterium]|nr:hypothetical protein [Ktedonobacteraceae bacterium]
MANSSRRPSRKQPDDEKRAESAPLKFPVDPDRHQGPWEDDDINVDDDEIASDPPRSPTSAIRYQPSPPAGSQRRTGTRTDRDTTRQPTPNVPGGQPRRAGQVSDAFPGPVAVRAGRTTATGNAPGAAAPPPVYRRSWQSLHWMFYVGVGMIAALALWFSFSTILAWGTAKYNDLVYGYPRFYQTDAVVGHGDSAAHPSHFVAMNLHGQVIVIELPASNPSKSYEYIGPDLIASGDDLIPITLSFSDVNHNGKPEMIIHIENREVIFCNDGAKFTQCSS